MIHLMLSVPMIYLSGASFAGKFNISIHEHRVTPNVVRPTQNLRLIDQGDSMVSLLKEGEELFIKESNGQFKKINEVIRMEDGITIPKAIFEEIRKVNNIKIEQIGNNLKAHIDIDELNKELLNCSTNSQDSSSCKVDVLSLLDSNKTPSSKIKATGNPICHPIPLSQENLKDYKPIIQDQIKIEIPVLPKEKIADFAEENPGITQKPI